MSFPIARTTIRGSDSGSSPLLDGYDEPESILNPLTCSQALTPDNAAQHHDGESGCERTRRLAHVDRSMCPSRSVPLPLRCGARLVGAADGFREPQIKAVLVQSECSMGRAITVRELGKLRQWPCASP